MTQGFGENKACMKENLNGTLTVQTKIGLNCPVGYEDMYKKMGMLGHNGVDWSTWHGEPVYHCDEFVGRVKHEHDLDGGLGVDIVSLEPLLYCEICKCKHFLKRRFWHGMDRGGQSALVGYEGRKVGLGELVMFADNTGASSGDHLHTSLKWCDQNGIGLHQENGYNGAIPDLDFENKFVGEVVNLDQMRMDIIGLIKSLIINLQAQIYAKR